MVAEDDDFDAIIIASGSEVEIALDSKKILNEQGKKIRVVSMPCTELFEEQNTAYQEEVLPSTCRARVAIEAGATQSWYKYVGFEGKIIGLDRFGGSAPYKELYAKFGISSDNLVAKVNELL